MTTTRSYGSQSEYAKYAYLQLNADSYDFRTTFLPLNFTCGQLNISSESLDVIFDETLYSYYIGCTLVNLYDVAMHVKVPLLDKMSLLSATFSELLLSLKKSAHTLRDYKVVCDMSNNSDTNLVHSVIQLDAFWMYFTSPHRNRFLIQYTPPKTTPT